MAYSNHMFQSHAATPVFEFFLMKSPTGQNRLQIENLADSRGIYQKRATAIQDAKSKLSAFLKIRALRGTKTAGVAEVDARIMEASGGLVALALGSPPLHPRKDGASGHPFPLLPKTEHPHFFQDRHKTGLAYLPGLAVRRRSVDNIAKKESRAKAVKHVHQRRNTTSYL